MERIAAKTQLVGGPAHGLWLHSLIRACEVGIGAVMVISGWLHLQNRMHFYIHVAQYRLLSGVPLRLFAVTLPWLLFLTGLLLMTRAGRPAGSVAAVLVFLSFFVAQSWVLISGLDIECGCFGTLLSRESGFGTAALSAVLCLMCAAIARASRAA